MRTLPAGRAHPPPAHPLRATAFLRPAALGLGLTLVLGILLPEPRVSDPGERPVFARRTAAGTMAPPSDVTHDRAPR